MLISIDNILKEIKLFYHSTFWKWRYYKRLRKESINVSTILKILRVTDSLIEDIKFKSYEDVTTLNGLSYAKIIELNRNIDIWEKDIDHFRNLIMHEFGHIQYNLNLFKQVCELNNLLFKNNPLPQGLKNELDIKYFSDHNEIRQRIIPIVKEMYENKWTAEEAYEKSCKYDDIFDLYDKDQIIYWIDNML